MSASKDAKNLRAWLAKQPYAIIGGVGGCETMVTGILDRLDELEWIVAAMRAASADRSPEGGDHEDGRHAKHESAVAATSGETPTPGPAIDQDGGEA